MAERRSGLERLVAALERVDEWLTQGLGRLEAGLLAGLFFSLVGIGLVQFGLRNLTGAEPAWTDGAMRAAFLWIVMLAGSLAARDLKHIRIDILVRRIPQPWSGRVQCTVLLFTALVCMAMVAAGLRIVVLEYQFQRNAFLDVPTWAVQVMIPIGFALMGWRFIRHALVPATDSKTENAKS